MPLPFEPACLPLLLSSLPHRNAAQALKMSRRYGGTLLTWPQLPQLSFREQSYVQSAIGFPGVVIDQANKRAYVDRTIAEHELDDLALAYLESNINYAALTGDDAVGLSELLRQGENLKQVQAVKGQSMGPISLAAQLTDERQRPLIYDEKLFDSLVQHLRLRVMWQETRLGEVANTTIICLDEPFLEIVGLPFMPFDWDEVRTRLDEVLSGVMGCKGLFAGGVVDWKQILNTSVELIVADVYHHSSSFIEFAESFGAFLRRDGVVGLGIVPSDPDELKHATPEGLLQIITSLLNSLKSTGIMPEMLLRQAVISASGALGHMDVVNAEHALQLVDDVSKRLRTQYHLN